MRTEKTSLKSSESWILLNILNEVCYGIYISDFNKTIGVNKNSVIELLDKILLKEKEETIFDLSRSDLEILKRSFLEVFRQIDEWEFETRIGITIQEAKTIQDKLK